MNHARNNMAASYVKTLCVSVLVFLSTSSSILAAESGSAHPYLTEKFFLDLGVYFPERKLRISVDGPTTPQNPDFDFSDAINVSRGDETALLNFGWRIGERWKLSAQYFRSADVFSAVLEDDIEWGDDVFPVDGEVITGQEFTLVRTLVGYEWSSDNNHAFGIGGGLHFLNLKVFMQGDIQIGGPGGPVADERRAVDLIAPLPNFGLWYRYSLAQKWALTARYDWLSASVGDYDGRMVNASVGVNYQVFDNFGIGANYNFFELDVAVSKDDWIGHAITSYDGLFVYLSAYW